MAAASEAPATAPDACLKKERREEPNAFVERTGVLMSQAFPYVLCGSVVTRTGNGPANCWRDKRGKLGIGAGSQTKAREPDPIVGIGGSRNQRPDRDLQKRATRRLPVWILSVKSFFIASSVKPVSAFVKPKSGAVQLLNLLDCFGGHFTYRPILIVLSHVLQGLQRGCRLGTDIAQQAGHLRAYVIALIGQPFGQNR